MGIITWSPVEPKDQSSDYGSGWDMEEVRNLKCAENIIRSMASSRTTSLFAREGNIDKEIDCVGSNVFN